MDVIRRGLRIVSGRDRLIYAKTLNEIRQKLRNEQYEDEKKLNNINLITMQQAFNELKTDMSRKDTRRIFIDIRYFNTFSLALETGMRIGELLGLKWSDIDFENQTIYVNRTLVYVTCRDEASPKYGKKMNEFHEPKTEKGKRKIPMTLKAYQILKRQKLWKAEIEAKGKKAPEGFEDLVFVTTRNAPVSQNDTDLVMKVISDRIAKEHEKFKPLTPHTLRHTFAIRCIERGMNPKTVQVILGHSSVNITMNLYCHVTEDKLISEMSKF